MLIDAGKQVELASLGRARTYQKLEQYDQSIPDFQKVIEIALAGEMAGVDPILAAGYYGLGTTYLAQDKPKDAIEWLEEIKFQPNLTIACQQVDCLSDPNHWATAE